jgi:sugar phosphate isomerase/epimerase
LDQLASRIAVVHLGDGHAPPSGEQNRTWLGQGRIPLKECIAALESAGFTGHYDVELLGEEIETADYADLLTHAKTKFESWWRACRQTHQV